jgi:hypothetical protein
MDTKLTLRMDSELIAKAKAWARERGVSLSQVIASFFEEVTDQTSNSGRLSAWVKSLSVKNSPYRKLTDNQIKAMRYADLEKKYR